MARFTGVLVLAACTLLAPTRGDGRTDEEPKKKPVTADAGEVGKLLTKWWKDGTAAGNAGDWYDNRDGEHSPLDLRPWPQLRKVKYSDDEVKRRLHWAFMPRTREQVTFGNSSTSGPPHLNGSNPRSAYCSPQGLMLIERQYLRNNLYIYPEHRDHDPGRNGVGDGYGDLYPTNTPYLLISQGSSGSDQPFMRAVPFTLAAFRPDVKKKLVESGLLMPTVQMVLRATNRNIKDEKEYLTGKAHPTVFDGNNVDALKMVKLAHEITADKVPPLVKLKVKEEDTTDPGRDFFEPLGLTEQHSDTASVIARIWRGAAGKRRLLVSAEGSVDVNKKPLTFTWVLLRGDEKRVTITPKDRAGTVAEITVAYHERRAIAPGSNLESNRVDVGVFAHNGAYYSAPAFVTFFSLDSEARTYDARGRVVEVGYGMGETELRVPDHAKLFAALSEEGTAAAVLALRKEQREEFGKLAKLVAALQAELEGVRKQRQKAEEKRNQADAELRQAEQELAKQKKEQKGEDEIKRATARLDAARDARTATEVEYKARVNRVGRVEKSLNEALDRDRESLGAGARPFAARALEAAVKSPAFWNDNLEALRERYQGKENAGRKARVDAARAKLRNLGVIADSKEDAITLKPARAGKGEPAERLTRYERALVEEFNAAVLAELVLPGLVAHTFRANFVDARLTTPKTWRDVYRYEGESIAGWTRYSPAANRPQEFTAEGWLVVAKDDAGRPTKARTVAYKQDAPARPTWVNTNPLKQVSGGEMITFEYDGAKRKVKSREKVLESK